MGGDLVEPLSCLARFMVAYVAGVLKNKPLFPKTKYMKHLFTILIAAAIALPSCKKTSSASSTFMNTATIKGPNLTMPPCGAAFLITIHGAADTGAQFNAVPAGSSINLSTAAFPINVKINWHHNTGSICDTTMNIITIDAVQLAE